MSIRFVCKTFPFLCLILIGSCTCALMRHFPSFNKERTNTAIENFVCFRIFTYENKPKLPPPSKKCFWITHLKNKKEISGYLPRHYDITLVTLNVVNRSIIFEFWSLDWYWKKQILWKKNYSCGFLSKGEYRCRPFKAFRFLSDSQHRSRIHQVRYTRGLTTIFTTTRLFFTHFWALCNTLPSIIPNMGSVWCYRNWIGHEGITMAPNYPVNLRWRVMYWLVRGFRVVDVARILHVWQIFVKKFRHFFTEIPARWIILCGGW